MGALGSLFYYFNGWGPLLYYFNGWALFYYFNGWGPFFIISTGGAPSLFFQRVGTLLYLFNGWGPFFINYFNGCMGPCSFVLTFRWLLIVINFRSNYSQIVTFQDLQVLQFQIFKIFVGLQSPSPRSLLCSIPGFALGLGFALILVSGSSITPTCGSSTFIPRHIAAGMDHAVAKRGKREWRDCNICKIF